MFRKHTARKCASASSLVVEEQNQEQERLLEEVVGPTPTPSTPSFEPVEDVLSLPPPSPPSGFDVDHLPHDIGERLPTTSYHANDQDAIRRAYILSCVPNYRVVL